MLTTRQKDIFKLLEKNMNDYLKGVTLANQLNCSLKTLQTEIKLLKSVLSNYDIEVQSVTSKGYNIIIHDSSKLATFKHEMIENDDRKDFNNQAVRINYILSCLLLNNDYIKSDNLADQMYISRSSISSDTKVVKKILEKYHLSIEHRPNYGVKVVGLEKNKRICIVKERINLDVDNHDVFNQPKKELISIISDVVIENLIKAKYRISDIVLQNLVLHIYVAVNRMKHNVYIEDATRALKNYDQECIIAKRILDALAAIYNFEIKDYEVQFLALHLLGKRSYEENDMITMEIDTFVNNLLAFIKTKIEIDFYGDVELKISLALHLVPLFVRLEHNMQLDNSMVADIRSNFPLAYDVAIIAAAYLNDEKRVILTDDEIGYLAVHFNLSLQEKKKKVNPKKVLVICSARRGDYLMIQHMFLREFNEMIKDLDIINAIELTKYNLDDYDCIFTTFLNHPLIPSSALRINFFIDQKDIQRIKRALLGEDESLELLKYFKKELFIPLIDSDQKEEVIKQMCNLANQYATFDEDLYQACLRREALGKTVYNNLIALPHPDSLIAHQTIVVTAILKKPIIWGHQKAQLIFLICCQKGNQQDLRVLFECISKFMMDSRSVEEVILKADYEAFLHNLGTLIV